MEMVNKIPVHDKKDKYLKRKIEREQNFTNREYTVVFEQFGVNKKHKIREKNQLNVLTFSFKYR